MTKIKEMIYLRGVFLKRQCYVVEILQDMDATDLHGDRRDRLSGFRPYPLTRTHQAIHVRLDSVPDTIPHIRPVVAHLLQDLHARITAYPLARMVAADPIDIHPVAGRLAALDTDA